MPSLTTFILIYTAGGLTFLPLLFAFILLHAYLTFPTHPRPSDNIRDHLRRQGDDEAILKSGTANIEKHGWPKESKDQEQDTASGYFAVCREFVPGGVNGKPPERTTPAGEKVSVDEPNAFQKVYGSLFDRKSNASHAGPNAQKQSKRAKNVFYIVLRHRHLMLYDDAEQTEVRHVISLDHHEVDTFNGADEPMPEGELWIRRNAIRLRRRGISKKQPPDGVVSKPFYLFSENCSEKEDFYFALLRNQESHPEEGFTAPRPLLFEVEHAVGLVQRLHSVDEHSATRWLNAMVGRFFLAMYKTDELQAYIRNKINKKISRVNRPAFLSEIRLQRVHMGSGAPQFTNIKLRDFNIDGGCSVEMDLHYSGGFRVEIATVAKIDLGARFKTREVDLVLAIKLKKLDGKMIVRFKPPPSNRAWMTFETMPIMDMSIEPIVSSRQLTYNIILNAIESRIREVMVETLILPHWDDIPFTNSTKQKVRGGIWTPDQPLDPAKTAVPAAEAEDATAEPLATASESAESNPASEAGDSVLLEQNEKTMSMPMLAADNSTMMHRKAHSTSHPMASGGATPPSPAETRPKSFRSPSFASTAAASIRTDTTAVESSRPQTPQIGSIATDSVQALASRSRQSSPPRSPVGSSYSAATFPRSFQEKATRSMISSTRNSADGDRPSRASLDGASEKLTATSTTARDIPLSGRRNTQKKSESSHDSGGEGTSPSGIKAAAGAAKQWGWNVINKRIQKQQQAQQAKGGQGTHFVSSRPGTADKPMGRGQPLPPIGEPLPKPAELEKINTASAVKRKSVASSVSPSRIPTRKGSNISMAASAALTPTTPTAPALPPRASLDASEPGGEPAVAAGVTRPEERESESPSLLDTDSQHHEQTVVASGGFGSGHEPSQPRGLP